MYVHQVPFRQNKWLVSYSSCHQLNWTFFFSIPPTVLQEATMHIAIRLTTNSILSVADHLSLANNWWGSEARWHRRKSQTLHHCAWISIYGPRISLDSINYDPVFITIIQACHKRFCGVIYNAGDSVTCITHAIHLELACVLMQPSWMAKIWIHSDELCLSCGNHSTDIASLRAACQLAVCCAQQHVPYLYIITHISKCVLTALCIK